MGFLTDLMYLLVAVVTAPWWARKHRAGWGERMGKGEILPAPAPGRQRLYIHAVSVGEVNLTAPLIARLREHVDIVLGATTDTGIARARQLFGSQVQVVRSPLDATWMVRRFMNRVNPDAVALVELELWPNMMRTCARRSIPVCVVNGRLSARSFGSYRRWRWLLGWMFRRLAFAAVQDEAYAARFRDMGTPADKVHIAGTMKWDSAFDAPPLGDAVARFADSFGIDRSRALIVAGSTGPGEAELIVEAVQQAGFDGQLLIAPRKPENFEAAAAAMPGCARRSTKARATPQTRYFLLDTIGELRAAYALADLVIIGRSFIDLHGSDPMEPAALGKPIIIGPRTEDFESAVNALRAHHAIVQIDTLQLKGAIRDLMADSLRRTELGRLALACVAQHRGAADRHVTLIRSMMKIGSAS